MKSFKESPEVERPRRNLQVVEPSYVGATLFMEQEIWKQIPGYEGMYEASNLGNIKSNLRKSGLLVQIKDSHGYYLVSLSSNGIVTKWFVHRLIVLAFRGLNLKNHIDHINGIPTDNRLENLRECTLEQNLRFNNIHKNKSSAYIGVCWHKGCNKWRAQIQHQGKKKILGNFETAELASECYQNALKELGL